MRSATVLPFEGEDAPLEPGRYAYEGFSGPPMTFAIGTGWVGGHVLAEFFDVQRGAAGVLLGFADPSFVYGPERAAEVEDVSVADAIGVIASNPAFNAGTVRSTTIDDLEAFEVRGSPTTSVELFGGEDGSFTAEPGSVRLLGVDVEGDLMLIVATGWKEQPRAVRRAIDAVIASVRFDDTAS